MGPWESRLASGAPTTEERVKAVAVLNGAVWDDDMIQAAAQLETDCPCWHVWPHINWGKGTDLIYVKRNNTGMSPFIVHTMREARAEIRRWESDHRHNSWAQA